jgi:uncharacterized membrane protein YGL010W
MASKETVMAASPFRPALDLMAQYAGYHRDRRNITTHFVGVPMIVFALLALLAGMRFTAGGITLSLALLVWILSSLWYLTRGEFILGLATVAANSLLLLLALPVADAGFGSWLGCGLSALALGWIIQFIGHYYEGRKPAFVDDLVGLLVAPMFVVGEALFMMGWGRDMLREIERRAGPTYLRDLAQPVA